MFGIIIKIRRYKPVQKNMHAHTHMRVCLYVCNYIACMRVFTLTIMEEGMLVRTVVSLFKRWAKCQNHCRSLIVCELTYGTLWARQILW